MPGFRDFIKSNLKQGAEGTFGGKAGLIFGPLAIADIAQADNKLKAVLRTLKDIVLFKPIMSAMFVGMFSSAGKSIRALVHDTGSLKAALDKLARIQNLQNIFTPLIGGAEAAKKKVAELTIFAANKNLRLESVGQAAKSLQIMTNGAMGGVRALEMMADAAAGTGNNIDGMAEAVGAFGAALRQGGSITAATEHLREIGAISQAGADKLNLMSEAGVGMTEMFTELEDQLGKFTGASDRAKESIEGVNAAYETAAANLQEKFGSPWKQEDIEHTKTMTAAMNAVAPAVESLSGTFNTVFGGAGKLKDKLLEVAASSGLLSSAIETLGRALTIVISGAALIASGKLINWLREGANAFQITAFEATALGARMNNLSMGMIGLERSTRLVTFGFKAMRVATAALGVYALIQVFVDVAGAVYRWSQKTNEAAKAMEDLRNANNEANAAIIAQGEAVKTLADRHEALAAALSAVTAAQNQYNEALRGGDQGKIEEARRNLGQAKSTASAIAGKSSSDLALTDEQRSEIRNKLERSRATEEQDWSNRYNAASPEDMVGLLQEKQGRFQSRADAAAPGERAKSIYSVASKDAEDKRMAAEAAAKEMQSAGEARNAAIEGFRSYRPTIKDITTGKAQQEIERRKATVDQATAEFESATSAHGEKARAAREARKKQEAVGVDLANKYPTSSVATEHELREAQKRGASGAEISTIQVELERRRRDEAERAQNEQIARQAKADEASVEREKAISNLRAEIEDRISSIKDHGYEREKAILDLRMEGIDREEELAKKRGESEAEKAQFHGQRKEVERAQFELDRQRSVSTLGVNSELGLQRAELGNDVKGMAAIKDFDLFAQKMEQLRGHGIVGQEARDISTQYATNAIAIDARRGSMAAIDASVGDSLTDIGGGGGIYAVQDDPNVSIGERTNTLLEQIDEKIGMLTGENKASLKLQ